MSLDRWAIHHDGRACGVCGAWLDPLQAGCHQAEENAQEAERRSRPVVISDCAEFYRYLARNPTKEPT